MRWDTQGTRKEGLSIRTWKLALALGLCALGVLVFVMLQLPSNHVSKSVDGVKISGEPPTSANYVDMYSGANNCSICHPDNWDGWTVTKHAWAYPTLMNTTHDAGYGQTCEPCHNTGAGKPSIYPATGYDPVTNGPVYLQNVTCQTCHGPASDHILAPSSDAAARRASIGLVLNGSLCGSCHSSSGNISSAHHPTYDEWAISGHNTSEDILEQVEGNVNCAPCHEAWTAIKNVENKPIGTSLRTPDEDAPPTWQLSCVVCHDPHSLGTARTQLRMPANQLCQQCHTHGTAVPGKAVHHPQAEVRNNTAGYLADREDLDYMEGIACSKCHMAENNAGLPNHTFNPNPYSCVTCHGAPDFPDNATAQAYIDGIAMRTGENVSEIQPLVDQAKALVAQMMGNRTNVLDIYRNEYNISAFNIDTITSDKSGGNHNPGLAMALLDDSRLRANAVIANLTPPEKITGITATDVGDGKINISWTASSATDFAKYRIYVLATSQTNVTYDTWIQEVSGNTTVSYQATGYSVDATYYVYVTAVDTNGNEITNVLSPVSVTLSGEEEEEEPGGGLSATLIAGIIVAAVIAVIVVAAMLMRKKKGSEPA